MTPYRRSFSRMFSSEPSHTFHPRGIVFVAASTGPANNLISPSHPSMKSPPSIQSVSATPSPGHRAIDKHGSLRGSASQDLVTAICFTQPEVNVGTAVAGRRDLVKRAEI